MGKASDLLVGNYGFDPRGQQRELQLAAGMGIQSRRSNQQLCIRHWRYSLPEATPLVAGDVIADLDLFTLLRRRAAWSLAGLITQRSEVRILPPRLRPQHRRKTAVPPMFGVRRGDPRRFKTAIVALRSSMSVFRRCSSTAERQPSKLHTRVRFSPSALRLLNSCNHSRISGCETYRTE